MGVWVWTYTKNSKLKQPISQGDVSETKVSWNLETEFKTQIPWNLVIYQCLKKLATKTIQFHPQSVKLWTSYFAMFPSKQLWLFEQKTRNRPRRRMRPVHPDIQCSFAELKCEAILRMPYLFLKNKITARCIEVMKACILLYRSSHHIIANHLKSSFMESPLLWQPFVIPDLWYKSKNQIYNSHPTKNDRYLSMHLSPSQIPRNIPSLISASF